MEKQQETNQQTISVQKKEEVKAGFGQGAFFAGKRKNSSDEAAAKCCSGGTCK